MHLAWEKLNGRSGHEIGLQLLEQLYRETTGNTLPSIEKTPRGKPYFPCSSLHFSISHTKDHVFCCLAEENIGMDAEEAHRPTRLTAASRFFSPAEQQRIRLANDPHAATLRLWVLKESYAKLTGQGLGDYLAETDFSPDDPRIQIIDGCYVAILTEKRN